MVDRALAGETFQEFDIVTEGQVNVDGLTYHGGGHLGVGGELGAIGDLYNSPSDVSSRLGSGSFRMLISLQPLFFFHHANMDRVWWTWEKRGASCIAAGSVPGLTKADFATRVKDISGPDTQFAYPFNFYGDVAYQNITLDYQMHVGHASNSSWVRVGDVMDIQDGVLCYEYDELY